MCNAQPGRKGQKFIDRSLYASQTDGMISLTHHHHNHLHHRRHQHQEHVHHQPISFLTVLDNLSTVYHVILKHCIVTPSRKLCTKIAEADLESLPVKKQNQDSLIWYLSFLGDRESNMIVCNMHSMVAASGMPTATAINCTTGPVCCATG